MELTLERLVGLAGVVQDPGAEGEHTTGGFGRGGWPVLLVDDDCGHTVGGWFAGAAGRVEPPWTVQFEFTGPPEFVTITLPDLGSAGIQLTYCNEGCPSRDRARALVGVGRMPDALEALLAGASR
jgi:hypothetical protein